MKTQNIKKKSHYIIPNLLILIFIILIILLSIVIGLYFYQFYSGGLSDITTDWGIFGDLLSGTLGPIISIINVMVLYRLTSVAHKIENNITEIEIKHEIYQDYFKIINELFFNVIRKYTKYLKDNNHEYPVDKDFEIELNLLKIFIEKFLVEIKELTSTKEYKEYTESITNFIKSIDIFLNCYNSEAKFKKSFSNFIDKKSELFKIVNKFLRISNYG